MQRTGTRLLTLVTAFAGALLSPGVSAQDYLDRMVTVVPKPPDPPGAGLTHGWSAFDNFTSRIVDVAVDPGRAVIACGNRRSGAQLMMLEPSTGSTIWSVTLVGTTVAKLVVDEEGSTYVAGNFYPGGFPDVLLAKIDAAGRLVWSYTYDEYNNNDEGLDVALGPDDSVVVTGHANGPLQGGNFFTAKLTRSGQLLWTGQVDGGPTSIADAAVAVAVDDQGGVLVTGTSKGSGTGLADDWLTAKYSPAGDLLWTRRHDGPAQSHDTPRDIAALSDGGCVVVGSTEDKNTANPTVIGYGPDGTLRWVNTVGGSGSGRASAVVLDDADNIYVTGSTRTSKNGFDILAMKLRPQGKRAWLQRWDGGEGRGDGGHAIAVDGRGHVFVAGHAYHWWSENDVATLVLDARRGKVLASAFFDGPASRHDTPLAIAADPSGAIFIGGYADGAYPYETALVLRYDYR